MMPKRALFEVTPKELAGWMTTRGIPGYHAGQVFRWVCDRRAVDFTAMSDLSRPLREAMDEAWAVFSTDVAWHDVAPDGTEKLLLRCRDGRSVECVLMAEEDRRTACISTQVGCGMGCIFCASGLKGVERNLTTAEIIEQVVRLRNLLPSDDRLTNIVVMGMGESLANLENLIAALDFLCSPSGLGLSQRRVTISTVGLPEKMHKLAELDRQYHLAVSLHAPTEELRDRLVPISGKVGLGAVMTAADAYFRKTGRQVTFEYVLLGGINDRPGDAAVLARLLAGRKAHVDLIPYNPVAGLSFSRPDDGVIRRFMAIVRAGGISVTVRKTKGRPIDAACGQLRRRVADGRSREVLPVGGPTPRRGEPG
jgi:23S rRNA (adenine2503-C2)-methyltransferase